MYRYGLKFIVNESTEVSFAIDERDRIIFHDLYRGDYELTDEEADLIVDTENILKTVKEMAVNETRKLSNNIEMIRFL